VTGGASGIGRALGWELALRGMRICIVDRDPASTHSTVSELTTSGFSAEARVADVTDERALTTMAISLREEGADIQWLVLCAGTTHVGALNEIPDTSGIRSDIDTDLLGPILCCRTFVPLLVRGARILMISSGFGLVGVAGYGAYCAAKAGVIAFGESLRRELLCRGIRVHVACPGDTDTPMLAREREQAPAWMNVKSARFMACAPRDMACRILRGCRGRRFLVIPSPEVRFVELAKRLLPEPLRNLLFDLMFARPPARGGHT